MSNSTIVSLALATVILVIQVMNACPLSTSLCKQYGHSCLGGHGKRSENDRTRLVKYLLKEIYDQPPKKEQRMLSKDMKFNKDYWEVSAEKAWESDSDESLNANFFT